MLQLKGRVRVDSFIQENSQSLGEPFHLNSCDNYSLESSPQLRPKNFMWPSPHSPLVMSPSLPCSSSSSCPSSSSCAPHSPDHASCVSSPGVSLYHHLPSRPLRRLASRFHLRGAFCSSCSLPSSLLKIQPG